MEIKSFVEGFVHYSECFRQVSVYYDLNPMNGYQQKLDVSYKNKSVNLILQGINKNIRGKEKELWR